MRGLPKLEPMGLIQVPEPFDDRDFLYEVIGAVEFLPEPPEALLHLVALASIAALARIRWACDPVDSTNPQYLCGLYLPSHFRSQLVVAG